VAKLEYWNKLTMGQRVIVASGILMLIDSFLPWYKYGGAGADLASQFGIRTTSNAWQAPGSFWSILAVLIALGMLALVVAVVFGNVQLPDLGQFTWGQAALAAGALALLFVVIRFLNHSGDLSYGFILGFIAAAGLAAGGYLRYTEEQGAGGVSKV
jgi:hypothetical protein